MPSSTNSLDLLVRSSHLSDDEWMELIEIRRELFKPLLNRMTLQKIGEIANSWHNPEVNGDERFSLETQGIYQMQPWEAVVRIPDSGHRPPKGWVAVPDGSRKYWGLTRSNQWVVVTVSFRGETAQHENHRKYPYGKGYERVYHVEIHERDLPTLLSETEVEGQDVWRHLGRKILEWEKSRLQAYNWAQEMANQVRTEEQLLSRIDS